MRLNPCTCHVWKSCCVLQSDVACALRTNIKHGLENELAGVGWLFKMHSPTSKCATVFFLLNCPEHRCVQIVQGGLDTSYTTFPSRQFLHNFSPFWRILEKPVRRRARSARRVCFRVDAVRSAASEVVGPPLIGSQFVGRPHNLWRGASRRVDTKTDTARTSCVPPDRLFQNSPKWRKVV